MLYPLSAYKRTGYSLDNLIVIEGADGTKSARFVESEGVVVLRLHLQRNGGPMFLKEQIDDCQEYLPTVASPAIGRQYAKGGDIDLLAKADGPERPNRLPFKPADIKASIVCQNILRNPVCCLLFRIVKCM